MELISAFSYQRSRSRALPNFAELPTQQKTAALVSPEARSESVSPQITLTVAPLDAQKLSHSLAPNPDKVLTEKEKYDLFYGNITNLKCLFRLYVDDLARIAEVVLDRYHPSESVQKLKGRFYNRVSIEVLSASEVQMILGTITASLQLISTELQAQFKANYPNDPRLTKIIADEAALKKFDEFLLTVKDGCSTEKNFIQELPLFHYYEKSPYSLDNKRADQIRQYSSLFTSSTI
jgi:hypothetical protein